MGRENTIRTGVSNSGRGRFINSNISLGTYNNFGIGKVTYVFKDKSIEYISLNNSYGLNKKGYAYPFDKNLTQLPPVGSSVTLVSTPIDSGEEIGRYGTRATFYTNIINPTGNVAGTIVEGYGSSTWIPSITISSQEKKDNILFTKNYLKDKGLSKEASAGIMGNIMTECTFDCTASTVDLNGNLSVGIIQWNGASYDVNQIPQNDLKGQLDKLFDTSFTKPISDYLQEVKNNPSGTNNSGFTAAGYFAYYFAWKIEICSACNEGPEIYRRGKQVTYPNGNVAFVEPSKRSFYADDFYNRFNDPSDSLSWNGVSISFTPSFLTNNTQPVDFTKSGDVILKLGAPSANTF